MSIDISENKNTNVPFSKGLEFASLLYIYVTICGIISEHIYYSHYNINISSFVEVSEIVFLIFDDLFKFIFAIVLGYFFTITLEAIAILLAFMINTFSVIRKHIRNKQIDLSSDNKNKLASESAKKWYYQLTIALLMLIFLIYYDTIPGEIRWCGAIGVLSKYIIDYKEHFYIRSRGISLCLLIFSMMMLLYPISKNKKLERDTNKVEILMNDSTRYLTGSRLRYLGSTKNYTFIYDSIDSTSLIINRIDIKYVKINN